MDHPNQLMKEGTMQMSSPVGTMSGRESIGNFQVNLDQNLNKFYALAQNNPLQTESQISKTSADKSGLATEQTQLHT